MATSQAIYGADLRLLEDLERQNSRSPGSDLSTINRSDPPAAPRIDLETHTGVENLQQALLLRFLTPHGELTPLGHPDYGSRLFELIGELNSEANRNRAKLFVLQALAAEPRVRQVLAVTVTPNTAERTRIDIDITLLAIDAPTPLNLVFPFSLAGGLAP